MSRGGCVGDIETGLRERGRCPDIGEGATAAMGDPQTGILRVPAPMRIGVGGQVGGIRADALAVGAEGAMAAEKTHVTWLISRLSVFTVTRNDSCLSTRSGCRAIDGAAPVCTFEVGHISSGIRRSRM